MMDLQPHTNFDVEAALADARAINPPSRSSRCRPGRARVCRPGSTGCWRESQPPEHRMVDRAHPIPLAPSPSDPLAPSPSDPSPRAHPIPSPEPIRSPSPEPSESPSPPRSGGGLGRGGWGAPKMNSREGRRILVRGVVPGRGVSALGVASGRSRQGLKGRVFQ